MQPGRRHILCVDDHDDTCSILTLLLGSQEYEVVTAGSAAEALDLARSQRFDLYVLDAWLPDGSGLELCAKLRALDPDTEVVFYSGAAYERDRLVGLSLGAAAYVIKPGIEELSETVAGLLGGAASVVGWSNLTGHDPLARIRV